MVLSATTYDPTHVSNRFSWQRVAMLARFYYPRLKRVLIGFSAIVVVAYLISMLSYVALESSKEIERAAALSAIGIIGWWMGMVFFFAPVALAKKPSDQATETMLPALAIEKWLFVIIYSFIFIPLLLGAVFGLCELISTILFGLPSLFKMWLKFRYEFLSDFDTPSLYFIMSSGWLQNLVYPVTGLYVVMRLTRNRRTMAAVWTLVSIVAISLIGVICGLISGIHNAYYTHGLSTVHGSDIDSSTITSIVTTVTHDMISFIIVMSILSLIYVIFMLWQTYRIIKTRQV